MFDYFTDATALSQRAADQRRSTSSPACRARTRWPSSRATRTTRVNNGKSTTKELLAFNDRVAPFDKAEVRKAVYSAIDTKKLLNSIWGDYGTLIGSMVPPTDPWYEDLTKVNPYDVDARQEGARRGRLPERLHVHARHPDLRPAPRGRRVPQERAGEGRHHREHQLDLAPTSGTRRCSRTTTSRRRCRSTSTTATSSGTATPTSTGATTTRRCTKWVDEAEQPTTTAEQTAKLKKVNEQIAKDAASAWLYLYPQIVVASSDVSGYPRERPELAVLRLRHRQEVALLETSGAMPGGPRSAAHPGTYAENDMAPYLLRRTAFLVVSLLLAMVVLFLLLRVLPGDPSNALLSVGATPEQIAAAQRAGRLATSRCSQQFFAWFGGMLTLNLGESFISSLPVGPGDRRAAGGDRPADPALLRARARAGAPDRLRRRLEGGPLVRHRAVRLLAARHRRAGVLGGHPAGERVRASPPGGSRPAGSRATTGPTRPPRSTRSRCR